MLVSELINKLQEFPQDMFVLGRGYESGYNGLDPEDMSVRTLVKCKTAWYDGMYQDVSDYNIEQRLDTPKEFVCLQ